MMNPTMIQKTVGNMIVKSLEWTLLYPRAFPAITIIILPVIVTGLLFEYDQINHTISTNTNIRFNFDSYLISLTVVTVSYLWGGHMRLLTNLFSDKAFDRTKLEKALIEFAFLKQVVIWAFTIFSIIVVLYAITYLIGMTDYDRYPNMDATFIDLMLIPLLMIVFGLSPHMTTFQEKQFNYYHAKGLFILSESEKINEIERITKIKTALKSYNKFLGNNIKLQIFNIERIYFKFISSSSQEMKKTISEINSCFEEVDKLQPLRYSHRLLKIDDQEQFLIEKPLRTKLSEYAPIFAFIASIVSILGAITKII